MKSSSSILIVLSIMLAAVSAAPVPADAANNPVVAKADKPAPKGKHAPAPALTEKECLAKKDHTWDSVKAQCDGPGKECRADGKYWFKNDCIAVCPKGYVGTEHHWCLKSTKKGGN